MVGQYDTYESLYGANLASVLGVSSLWTTFPTTVGASWNISYSLKNTWTAQDNLTSTNSWTASWNGLVLESLRGIPATGYIPRWFLVQSPAATSNLTFRYRAVIPHRHVHVSDQTLCYLHGGSHVPYKFHDA
jgi:hypothetical protein